MPTHSPQNPAGGSRLSAALLGGGVAGLVALMPAAASGATVPKPSASCKTPVFTVSPLKAAPGSMVTVSGVNFSGCPAQGNPAKPTPVLTIRVGVETASKMGKLLATTKTSANGSFSVKVTVPNLSSGGVPKLALVAEGKDPATGLTYAGIAVLAYSTPGATTKPTAPTTPAGGGGVPTAVPAGNGGQAATTSSATIEEQAALAGAGLVLLLAAGAGPARRRLRRRHH